MRSIDQIRQAMHAQPFRPFSLKLVDGTIYTVPHYDWLSIPPVRRPREVIYFSVPSDAGNGEDYESHWIDLSLILEVIVSREPAASARESPAEGNGNDG
jgi:hypothetical protein